MTALDDDMAAVRERLVAALHDQPTVRAVMDIPAIVAVVDVAIAAAGLRDTATALVAADAAVAAVGAPPPGPLADAVADYQDVRPAAHDNFPTALP